MNSRPAPPGRRGSVKKEAFKADDETSSVTVTPVPPPTAADRARAEREEEMRRTLELRKKAQVEEEEALTQRRAEEARNRLEAQKTDNAKKQLEENKNLISAQQEATAKAEQASKLAEEKRLLLKKTENEKMQVEAARLQQLENARLEKEAQEKEELAYQREQEQQRQAIEDARKKREAAEAQRQAEQLEIMHKQQQLEEQQRRMDEKLARQKEIMAEAAAVENQARLEAQRRQELEQQQRDKAQRELIAAQKVAEQAEIERLRAEEEDRQRAAVAAQMKEQEEHEAEVLRMEQERAAAAEEARRAESAISEFESAALQEKKRRAEEQRKKRAMFLNEMDSFSTTFEAKTQVQEDSLKQEQEKHYELLGQQMKQVEDAKAALLAKEASEKDQRQAAAAAAALAASASAARPQPAVATPVISEPAKDTYRIDLEADANSQNLLEDLSSTLFTASSASASTSGALAMDAPPSSESAAEEQPLAIEEVAEEEEAPAGAVASDELRVPTRIGSGKPKQKGPLKPAPVAVITAKAAAAIQRYSEDEEEEGTGEIGSISNVLTLEERRKMTVAQKESWRAKQADLTERRKDFHGVVTYTFDGVFSWQMYGSAEAVDETGSNYTEYLMRCQWGTTFENMQPWIVAHRYKEFDALDQALKKKFPRLESNMPKLPKKEFFRALHSDVVAERRAILEEYMSKIVSSMPSLLRSELMNDFLDITNRISGIRLMLLKASNARVQAESNSGAAAEGGVSAKSGTVATPPAAAAKASGTGVSSNSKYGIEDPLAYKATGAAAATGTELFAGDVEDEPLYWNMDDAEEARAAKNARSLDEDQLGQLEIDVRTLGQLLRKGDNKALVAKDSKFRSKFKTVSKRWPNLRATAVVGMGVDFTLIPRAMQAEEDLVRFLNEFRNIETAHSLTSSRMAAV